MRLRQFDGEPRPVPADVDVIDEAERLAGRVFAVAVVIHERDKPVQPFADVAALDAGSVCLDAGSVGLRQVIGSRSVGTRRLVRPRDVGVTARQVELVIPDRAQRTRVRGDFRRCEIGVARQRIAAEVNRHLARRVVDRTDKGLLRRPERSDDRRIEQAGSVRIPIRNDDLPRGICGVSVIGQLIVAVQGRHETVTQVAEADLHRTRRHHAGPKRIGRLLRRIQPQIPRMRCRRDVRTDVRHRPDRIRSGGHAGIRLLAPRLEHDRRTDDIRLVVDDGRLNRGNGILANEIPVARAGGNRLGRVRAHLRLRIVRPAVVIEILLRIVDILVRIEDAVCVGLRILALPQVVNLVEVGEDLAEIEVADAAEVVGAGPVRLRERRIEPRELEDLADEILRVIRKAVAIRIGELVIRASGVDAVDFLPPVGDAVAVKVTRIGELGVVFAVGQHAARQVAAIRLPRRHADAVVIDHRLPVDCARRIEDVVVPGDLRPPVGQSAVVPVRAGLRPGVRRALVVPHAALGGGNALRIRAAHRQQVVADHVAVAPVEAVRRLLLGVRRDEIPARRRRLDPRRIAVVENLRPAAVDFGRAGEREERIARIHRRDRPGVVRAPIDRVERRSVKSRQMRDGVVDPRHIRGVGVDRRANGDVRPPRALPVLRPHPHGLRVRNGFPRREPGRRDHHVVLLNRTRQMVERPVVFQFRRELEDAAVLPRAALAPNLVDRLTVRARQRGRIARAVLDVRRDVRRAPRAVPDANFVDIAPVVVAVIVERRVLAIRDALTEVEVDGVHVERRCAHQIGDGRILRVIVGPDRRPRGDAMLGLNR